LVLAILMSAEARAMALTFEAVSVPLSMDDTGTVRVHGTRLTLDTVLGAYERGDTPQEIVEGFPDLSVADVYAILAFYFHHREEVDAYIQEKEARGDELRKMIEARQGSQEGLRERLLARRAQRQTT
jgi:uncharacterized protein (DUF433 family)